MEGGGKYPVNEKGKSKIDLQGMNVGKKGEGIQNRTHKKEEKIQPEV